MMSEHADMEKRDLETPVYGDGVEKNEVNVDTEHGTLGIDHVAEKKLIRKIDLNLMTLFGALYLMSFLDRSNIGNANLTGFSKDLHLVNNQYGAAVSVVYATYVVFEPFWTVLLKILKPKRLLTASTVCWAALTIGTAFTKSFSQLAAVRVLLGAVEAAIIPCIFMYITMTYNRDEYALRTTFCLAPITWIWLPNSVSEAVWLNKEEKALVAVRLERNKGVYDEKEKFSWSEIFRCFKDWKCYLQAISHFGIDTTLYAVTTFMPKIIAGLGFTTTVNAQLLTVPVYFVAAVSYIILGYLSDKYKKKSDILDRAISHFGIDTTLYAVTTFMPKIIAGLGFTTTVNAQLLTVPVYFVAAVSYIILGYLSDKYKKHATYSAGAAIGFIFKAQDAPRYFEGCWFALGMMIMSITCTAITTVGVRRANKIKLKLIEEGAPDQPELGDRNPHFLFYV
ncbi:uncharacterized protein PAC_14170 [Phialocephala subalpina]|uniref:Allantoate permease n=1 Tax=Phialocephala subalpina TaxID=576137 RepID=A0A1L7XGX7_9HELO|nr:uncharacterized protein PAC_14170 [Phialocephala subalpina]